jgi:hypothetical protein
MIWITDAHRGDSKRFVARADEKLTAFLEFQSAIRTLRRIVLTDRRDFFKTRRRKKDLNQAEDFPPLGSSPAPDLCAFSTVMNIIRHPAQIAHTDAISHSKCSQLMI